MIKKKKIIFFLIFFLSSNCSFDKVTGIWSGTEDEKKKMSELEKDQKQILNIEKLYSSEKIFTKEIRLSKKIILSEPKKNSSWLMSGLNQQNFTGNIYLPNVNNVFLKKKIGKDKHSGSKNITSLLIFKNNIITSDDRGTIFKTDEKGKVIWKINIYKKMYKRIYKNLTFSIYKNNIYINDNLGFIYVINFNSGKLVWIKNHGIPIKSNIKVFDDKIFLIDQDNKIICLNIKDGSKIWDIRSVSSFIKSQNLMSLAVSKSGNLISINSSADLFKADGNTGELYWSRNTAEALLASETDFFIFSEVVIIDNEVIFSASTSFFSYDITNGNLNWRNDEVSSVGTPIIDGKNIFIVTNNGYFVILDKDTGEIISSTNILKILKKRKRLTKVTGFIMGSGKLYIVTLNGYLIVCSAYSGKVEYFKKIGNPITTSPIINNGKLFILTENSKIIGLN